MARRLHAAGVAAILVPSFAPGATHLDRNLVFWRWSQTSPHQFIVVDDHGRLPRSAVSWS